MSISSARNSLFPRGIYSFIRILDRSSFYWIQIHLPLTLGSLLPPPGLSSTNIIIFYVTTLQIFEEIYHASSLPHLPPCLCPLCLRLNNLERTVIYETEARTLTSLVKFSILPSRRCTFFPFGIIINILPYLSLLELISHRLLIAHALLSPSPVSWNIIHTNQDTWIHQRIGELF